MSFLTRTDYQLNPHHRLCWKERKTCLCIITNWRRNKIICEKMFSSNKNTIWRWKSWTTPNRQVYQQFNPQYLCFKTLINKYVFCVASLFSISASCNWSITYFAVINSLMSLSCNALLRSLIVLYYQNQAYLFFHVHLFGWNL